MSKYIKLEDAIEAYNQAVTNLVESEMEEFDLGDFTECQFDTTQIKLIARMIESLPTIEVSEDCISREYLLSKAYDMDNDNLVVDLKDIEDAPSVVPTADNLSAVEDCISREYILSFLDGEIWGDDDYIAGMNDEQREIREVVRNAPSVVPSRAEGEWKRHPIHENRAWDVCTACGTGCRRRHYGFNEDGTEWVEEANYPYCPNCGAKMKGAEE